MKWLKICALLILTLAAMRVASWAVAWALTKAVRTKIRTAAVVSNVVAFAAFVLLLYVSLLPGEPVDFAAVCFGFAVFAVYTVADFYWRPWKITVKPDTQGRSTYCGRP